MDKDTTGGIEGERKKREILRHEGISWETLKKILAHLEPAGYRLKEPRPRPKVGPYIEYLLRNKFFILSLTMGLNSIAEYIHA